MSFSGRRPWAWPTDIALGGDPGNRHNRNRRPQVHEDHTTEVLTEFHDETLLIDAPSGAGLLKVGTDAGIVGYSFTRMDPRPIIEQARQALIGKDPHALEEHLKNELLQWATTEHALWDIIGLAVWGVDCAPTARPSRLLARGNRIAPLFA